MNCPYKNPTVQQCEFCSFEDCVRDEHQDHNDYNREWNRKQPERRRAIRYRYYLNHKEQEHANSRKKYQRIKDTPEYKAMMHANYLKMKNTSEYKERKKESNRRYRERMKAERVS